MFLIIRKLSRRDQQHDLDKVKIKSLEEDNDLLRLKYCTIEEQLNKILESSEMIIPPSQPVCTSPVSQNTKNKLMDSDDTIPYDSVSFSQVCV